MGVTGLFSDWLMVCHLELVLYGCSWLVFKLVNGLPPKAGTLWVGLLNLTLRFKSDGEKAKNDTKT